MHTLIVLIVVLLLAGVAAAQKTVSFSIVGAAWEPELLAMRRSPRGRGKSIVWSFWAGGSPNGPAERLKLPALFIVARDDSNDDGPRLPRIQEQYKKAAEPKALIILEGSAHAQYLFQTDHAERAMHVILKFLSAQ